MSVTWITKEKGTDDFWVSEGGSGRLKFTRQQTETWIGNFNQAYKKGVIATTDRPVDLNTSARVVDIAQVTESARGSLSLMGVDLSGYQ